ncbi:MAG: hypothetical protein ACP5KG_02745 [Myxococcota bacterium]
MDNEGRSREEADKADEEYKRDATIANISYITGGLLIGGGIISWFLSGEDKGEEKSGIKARYGINNLMIGINF